MNLSLCFDTYTLTFVDTQIIGSPESTRKIRPAYAITSIEYMLRDYNPTKAGWMRKSVEELVNFNPSGDLEDIVVACPVWLPASILAAAYSLYELEDQSENRLRQLLARAMRLLNSASETFRPHSHASLVHLQSKWPNVDMLLKKLFKARRCRLGKEEKRPTLASALIDGFTEEDFACMAGPASLSPKSYFVATRPYRDRTPSGLFRKMMPLFEARPAPFRFPGLEATLQLVLQDYLSTPTALNGMVLEFGVCEGKTSKLMADHARKVWRRHTMTGPPPTVVGFDSFQGLPRAWKTYKKGAFTPKEGHKPEAAENLRLVTGWFNDTVPAFLEGVAAVVDSSTAPRTSRLSLGHFDADLYESTRPVLEWLLPFMSDGTALEVAQTV
eukprot:TRINITY_DN28281_c0_g1_i2.p1 TRINITY_DN28281_c0_g1~~TRINITY_DN28281_c0_g1_i2.p1  ORF type:complete len:385 (+),score=51.70 TRINITY_DN28281_c0_g1_i2:217-1371(+)